MVEEGARESVDCLVVAGGDGTWHEVLQVHTMLAQPDTRSIPVALLPIGTGDDNARSLGFPRRDPSALARAIDAGKTRRVDLGLVHHSGGRRWFSGVLSVGFDSAVNARANEYQRLPGTLRYLSAVAAELFRYPASEYTVTTPTGTRRIRAMLIAVGNGGYYGGGMAICPGFDLQDGAVETTIITAMPKARFITTMPTVYSGRHVRQREVITLRSESVAISGDQELVFADGEPVGTVPISVECVPRALTIICA